MNAFFIIFFGLIALVNALTMAVGHKDFEESLSGNIMRLVVFSLLPWAGALFIWSRSIKESKPKVDTDADAKFHYRIGIIFGAILFFVCIAFTLLLSIPRILASDT